MFSKHRGTHFWEDQTFMKILHKGLYRSCYHASVRLFPAHWVLQQVLLTQKLSCRRTDIWGAFVFWLPGHPRESCRGGECCSSFWCLCPGLLPGVVGGDAWEGAGPEFRPELEGAPTGGGNSQVPSGHAARTQPLGGGGKNPLPGEI